MTTDTLAVLQAGPRNRSRVLRSVSRHCVYVVAQVEGIKAPANRHLSNTAAASLADATSHKVNQGNPK